MTQPLTVPQGKIHREPSPREVPRFELFFDLLFVAIIHQLGERFHALVCRRLLGHIVEKDVR
jgi:low temperature requirement protein LtrA